MAAEPSDRSNEVGPRLPIELLIPIMELLDASNAQKTLFNLMRTARDPFQVGAPIFARHLRLIMNEGRRLLSFMDTFGPYLKHTRRLDIVGIDGQAGHGDDKEDWEQHLVPILQSTIPSNNLSHLSIEAFSKNLLKVIWIQLRHASPSLIRIDLSLWPLSRRFFTSSYEFPFSVSRVDLAFPGTCTDKSHVLGMLRYRCPGLEEWNLCSPFEKSMHAMMTNPWHGPTLASKLREAVFDLGTEDPANRFFQFRSANPTTRDTALVLRKVEFRNVDKPTALLDLLLRQLKDVSHIILKGAYRTDRLWADLANLSWTPLKFEIRDPRPSGVSELEGMFGGQGQQYPGLRVTLPEKLVLYETPGFWHQDGEGDEALLAEEEKRFWKRKADRGVVWVDAIKGKERV